MALAICKERSATELRAYARRAPSPRAAARTYGLANALEGMTRAEAARPAGMERQALRDAVLRYNPEGLSGLEDRPKSGRPPGLTEGEQAALAAIILRGPHPERDGISVYTREDLARIIDKWFGRRYHPSSLSGVLRRLGFSRQKTRPSHPRSDPAAQARWVKRAPRRPEHDHGGAPGQADCAVVQDEARVGQKGRTCQAWWLRGQRPAGIDDKRFSFAYMFAAVEPATGRSNCLVLPEVSTAAMQAFLESFSATLATDVHAALVVDGAGWHVSLNLRVPGNMTLVPLPPYAPELNPVERVWLYLRERFLRGCQRSRYLGAIRLSMRRVAAISISVSDVCALNS